MKYQSFAAHNFHNLEDAPFCAKQYSRLKFGSDAAAKKLGYELAAAYFYQHASVLIANRTVVIPSPYNHVPNAATVMTTHFVDRLNELLVDVCGRHIETSIIHRKVSYTNDYGFLSQEKRKELIDNDQFHLNRAFLEGKMLVFVDDVRITGTHEVKLKEILERDGVPNQAMFLYYANYSGLQADIEGQLNFADMKSLEDYIALANEANHHVIIRPIKWLLSQCPEALAAALNQLSPEFIRKVFYGCLAEGYYKIPAYQHNFGVISKHKLACQAY